MQYKNGYCWEAAYDEERDLYTAGVFSPVTGSCMLYEISRDIFDTLKDSMDNRATQIIGDGRKLYMYVNDQYGMPYTIVFDEDYKALCPWASVPEPDPKETWSEEMTDAVVNALDSEKDNREQRKKKREQTKDNTEN